MRKFVRGHGWLSVATHGFLATDLPGVKDIRVPLEFLLRPGKVDRTFFIDEPEEGL